MEPIQTLPHTIDPQLVAIRNSSLIRPYLLDVVRELKERPRMVLENPTYDSVCAYLSGYDHCLVAVGKGQDGLDYFREWIVGKLGDGVSEKPWDLVPRFCPSGAAAASDDEKCETLYALIEEFWVERQRLGIVALCRGFSEVCERKGKSS